MLHVPSTHPRTNAAELADEIQRLFEEIDRTVPPAMPETTGESSPTLDVIESSEGIEVVVDLPGITCQAIRVVLSNGILVIAGTKHQAASGQAPGEVYHLVERRFGRFARAIHLGVAVDGSRARAALANGELRIVVPRIAERRGRPLRIPIEDGT